MSDKISWKPGDSYCGTAEEAINYAVDNSTNERLGLFFQAWVEGDLSEYPGFTFNPESKSRRSGDAAEVGKRASHYGNGKQPWDFILEAGWGPAFAAGNALKYIRRYKNKNGDDDLAKAKWYYHELVTRAMSEAEASNRAGWADAWVLLKRMITIEEMKIFMTSKGNPNVE